MLNKGIMKALEGMEVADQGSNPNPGPVLTDFKKLLVVYSCTANGKEALCTRFSPGPGGNCTLQENLNQLTLCKA